MARRARAVPWAVLGALACASPAPPAGPAPAPAADYPITRADVDFVTGMISHHAQALEMARLAPERAASRAVQVLAARILNAQTDEIVLLQQWLEDRGTYALARHTAIDRRTRDLDLMIRRRDWSATARALRAGGIYTRLSFPHWLGKALSGQSQVDIIYSGGNGLTRVDDSWFERAVPARVLGYQVQLCAPEELIWSKAFVMERERYDGADVLHLMLARAETLDWLHLCSRFRGHEAVLLSYVMLFGYVHPGEASRLPFWLIPRLLEAADPPRPRTGRLCRGTLLSRRQYRVDVGDWGYRDARLEPEGRMTREDVARFERQERRARTRS